MSKKVIKYKIYKNRARARVWPLFVRCGGGGARGSPLLMLRMEEGLVAPGPPWGLRHGGGGLGGWERGGEWGALFRSVPPPSPLGRHPFCKNGGKWGGV